MTLVSRRFYPIATSLLHEHIAFFDYKLAKALVKAHDLHSETPKCKILARYTSNLALHEDLHLSASDYRNTVERQTFADIFGACNGGQIRTLMIGFNPVNDLAKHICYVKAIEKAEMRPTKLTLLRSKFQIAMLLLVYLGATLEDLRLRDLTDLSSFSTSIPYGKVLRNLVALELSTDNLIPQAEVSCLTSGSSTSTQETHSLWPIDVVPVGQLVCCCTLSL